MDDRGWEAEYLQGGTSEALRREFSRMRENSDQRAHRVALDDVLRFLSRMSRLAVKTPRRRIEGKFLI
ncbi:MAG: hypothetical protein AAB320_09065 [Elusimicrobiota bacterium]